MGCGPLCESSGCSLAKSGHGFTQVEIGNGYDRTRLLLIGEASGEAESRESLPFRPYAQSGSLLSDALREVQVSRSEVAITNIVRCRPPKDWLIGAPYESNAISHCITNYLFDVIRDIKPRAILALGGTAMRALTASPKGKYGTLDYLRGYIVEGAGAALGIPVISTYHPAFIRRGAAHLTPLLQRDLRRAFLVAQSRLLRGQHWGCPEDFKLNYQTSPTIDEAWAFAEGIDSDLPLAFDIETPLSTRSDEDERTSFTDRDIKLFQCTQQRGAGIALPFRDEFIAVIKTIMGRVRTRTGFNNWNFDDPVLATNGIDCGVTDDAMVMFGFLWSDLPKNLQAAAQLAGFPTPWKHLADQDLALYGCFDVDATLCVYNYCKEKMESEGNWDSYRRYFAQVWPILRDMSRRGIPISESKRMELKDLILREDQRVTVEIQGVVPEGVKGHTKPLKRVPKSTEGMIQVEVGIEKEERCQCLKKDRGTCAICAGSGTIPAGSVVKRWASPVEFNPNSWKQVLKLIKFLKHPVPKHMKRTDSQGEAAETTEAKELERLAARTKHPVYPLLIEKRQLKKVEGTYYEGWAPWDDGCVHPTFTYNTSIWQLSARQPNSQNGIKHADPDKHPLKYRLKEAFNGMQHAQDGHVLINFDWKSFFPITMSHDFNMPRYCRLARIDIHSFVTCYFLHLPERMGLWERDDEDMKGLFKFLKRGDRFKFTRDYKSKRVILGMGNGLFYRKMYQVHKEDFENEKEAKDLYETVIGLFPELPRGQQKVKAQAAEDKKLVNKFGAIRHFYDVQRWDRKQQKWVGGDQAEAAIAFLPSSHAFGHARDVMLRLREKGWDSKYGLINTIHDSLTFHCPNEYRDECLVNVKEEMERPSQVLIYPEMAPDGEWVAVEAAMGANLDNMQEVK